MLKKIFIFSFLACSGCQWTSDRSDQQALKHQCHIPDYAKIIQYEGFPSMNGFGQREGLRIKGVFSIPADKTSDFEQFAQEDGWVALPITEMTRDIMPGKGINLSNELSPKKGFYRCHTAGNNVLHSQNTRKCNEAKLIDHMVPVFDDKTGIKYDTNGQPMYKLSHSGLSDVILSVYDGETGTISAVVQSSY